jgi:hypothetical protein
MAHQGDTRAKRGETRLTTIFCNDPDQGGVAVQIRFFFGSADLL